MQDCSERCILHLDMDAFFAAIEVGRRPELRGRPVVVGGTGDPQRRGVVSTASYEARRFGVRSGMPLRTAHQRCPQAVFLPVDYATYQRVSRRIKAVLREFCALMEDVGIDEAYLDISESAQDPTDLARALKRRVVQETGLTCSIGVGPNKLLAKIASDMDKPDGLTILDAEALERRVWPLPVRKLWGVGPKTECRLRDSLGVRTIGDLARVPEEDLLLHFGQSHGRYMHRAALGLDDRPLVIRREPKSVSRETTFQSDVEDDAVVRGMLIRLSRNLAGRLRSRRLGGAVVTVKVRLSDFETHTRAVTLPQASDDAKAIADAALACLARLPRTKKVRLVGIRISHLSGTPPGGSAPGGH